MVLVIGGANIDILGYSTKSLIPGDSNPGKIRITPGGVGRNIAQAMASYTPEKQVELITLLGDDPHSRMVKDETEKSGVSMKHSIVIPGESCPTYLAVMDRGEMVSAVNDMTLLEKLTPQRLKSSSFLIEKAGMIILDANIPEETILWLTEKFPHSSFIAEPVSAAKCGRFFPVLDRLFCLKPNRMEAERLTGLEIHDIPEALEAVTNLVNHGTRNVIITLGSDGAVYGSQEGTGHIAPLALKGQIKNTNGAGDTLLAGVLTALGEGKTLAESVRRGSRLAEKAITEN